MAISAGVNISGFSRLVYIFPTPTGCSYGGLGTIGGGPGRSWVFNYYQDRRVYGHELGHNLGIHHAASISCGAKAIDVYQNCSYDEYGDYFDVMGNFWFVSPQMHHFNGVHKQSVGWIAPGQIAQVSESGTFELSGLEGLSQGLQILKIAKPNTNESYFVSFRQSIGFDLGLIAGLTRGVSIHIGNDNPAIQSKFIDVTPGTGDFSGFGDATLSDGQSFIDLLNNIQVSQISHDQDSAQVEVRFLSVTPTPTRTPTPTTASLPTPTTVATAFTADFNNLSSPNRVFSGQYPSGKLSWPTNQWFLSSPWGAFITNSMSTISTRTSSSFSVLTNNILSGLDLYNGGKGSSTITLSCAGNPNKVVAINPQQLLTNVATGWTVRCATITFKSSNGWDTNFDNLRFK